MNNYKNSDLDFSIQTLYFTAFTHAHNALLSTYRKIKISRNSIFIILIKRKDKQISNLKTVCMF